MVGGLSLLQVFIFIPLFAPSQEGLSSPLLILLYSVDLVVCHHLGVGPSDA